VSVGATIADRFDQAVALHGGRVFLDQIGGRTWTFAEAAREVALSATHLDGCGIGPGVRVALCLDNEPAFFLHLLACARLGASVVPVGAGLGAGERAHLLAAARPVAVIAWERHVALFAGSGLPVAAPNQSFATLPIRAAAPGEAALLFTSGTTGAPKACILGHDYFVRAGLHYAAIGGLCAFASEGDRILTPLPVTHMNALACSLMAAIETGSALIQLDRFHASSWWESVRDARASVVHYLGVMPAILLQLPPLPTDRAHGVRFGFGAGVDPRHHAAFEERFGFALVEAWAMTETGGGAWMTASHEPRHVGTRCFGRAGPELEARVVGDDCGDAAAGEPGELLVRAAGPDPRAGFFAGYDGDREGTEAAWAGGWFHTGDIVRRDAEGSFFFVDRAKNIVRRSGENIAAVEVEGSLLAHPAVGAAAVCPVDDELRGEEVMALIVPAPGHAGDAALAAALHDHVAAELAYHKAPGWIDFVDALPTTGSEKLQRGAIRALGRAAVADGTAHDLRERKRRR
jgi:acyl-coenzyme A synthetase/AMP-(fatty) acid ligase